jgi:hypothetical protein
LITGSDPDMTHDPSVPPEHTVFSWDGPHACGMTSRPQHAITEAHIAVVRAEIGTIAIVRSGHLTGDLPHYTIGYAVRTKAGVRWNSGPPPL